MGREVQYSGSVAPWSLLSLYRCFSGTHLLELQGAFVLKMET